MASEPSGSRDLVSHRRGSRRVRRPGGTRPVPPAGWAVEGGGSREQPCEAGRMEVCGGGGGVRDRGPSAGGCGVLRPCGHAPLQWSGTWLSTGHSPCQRPAVESRSQSPGVGETWSGSQDCDTVRVSPARGTACHRRGISGRASSSQPSDDAVRPVGEGEGMWMTVEGLFWRGRGMVVPVSLVLTVPTVGSGRSSEDRVDDCTTLRSVGETASGGDSTVRGRQGPNCGLPSPTAFTGVGRVGVPTPAAGTRRRCMGTPGYGPGM